MIKYDRENQKWVFYPKKITITDRGTERIKYTDDVSYYEEMANKHDFLTVDKVEDFEPTQTQLDRLAGINSIETDQRFTGTYVNYIQTGELPTDYIGKLKDLKIKKGQSMQDNDIADLLFELMNKGVI